MTLKQQIWSYVSLIFAFNCLISPALLFAAVEESTPFPGVRYVHEVRSDPTVSLHIITVDLTNPNVALRVAPGGADPDGSGPWQTTLLPVPKIAEREHFDLAINGDYFAAEQAVDPDSADGLAALAAGGYRTGQRATVMGTAVTDGKQWAQAPVPKPTLMVAADGKVTCDEVKTLPANVSQAITGNFYLVTAGVPGNHRGAERNARTGVGIDRARTTLTIIVVDGLWEGRASGLTTVDLVREFAERGCYYAISLDGGGSTTLVMRESAGGKDKYRVLNHPTDGRPRPVANALGINVKSVGK